MENINLEHIGKLLVGFCIGFWFGTEMMKRAVLRSERRNRQNNDFGTRDWYKREINHFIPRFMGTFSIDSIPGSAIVTVKLNLIGWLFFTKERLENHLVENGMVGTRYKFKKRFRIL